MVLHDAVQINEIAVDIVDRFDGRRRTKEVQCSTAREYLDVALVFRKTR
jgi:hypothetical protein